MPKGPRGEKRPGDVIGAAIMVGRIATGEIEEQKVERRTVSETRRIAAQARAERTPQDRRVEIAKGAAKARWDTKKASPKPSDEVK